MSLAADRASINQEIRRPQIRSIEPDTLLPHRLLNTAFFMKLDPVITLVLGSRLPFKEIPQLLYHQPTNTNLDSYQSSGFNILDDLKRYTGLSVTAVLENDSPCPEKQRWQTAQAPRDNGKLYRKIQGEKDEDTRQLATHNINNIVQR